MKEKHIRLREREREREIERVSERERAKEREGEKEWKRMKERRVKMIRRRLREKKKARKKIIYKVFLLLKTMRLQPIARVFDIKFAMYKCNIIFTFYIICSVGEKVSYHRFPRLKNINCFYSKGFWSQPISNVPGQGKKTKFPVSLYYYIYGWGVILG